MPWDRGPGWVCFLVVSAENLNLFALVNSITTSSQLSLALSVIRFHLIDNITQ